MKSFRYIFAIIASLVLLIPGNIQSQITSISPGQKAPYSIGFTAGSASPTTVTIGKQKGYYTALASGTIIGFNFSIDAGTATVKTWKIAAGVAVPTVANLISTAGVAISTGTHLDSTTVSDFTTVAVAAGDVFAFDLISASTATDLTFNIKIMPTK